MQCWSRSQASSTHSSPCSLAKTAAIGIIRPNWAGSMRSHYKRTADTGRGAQACAKTRLNRTGKRRGKSRRLCGGRPLTLETRVVGKLPASQPQDSEMDYQTIVLPRRLRALYGVTLGLRRASPRAWPDRAAGSFAALQRSSHIFSHATTFMRNAHSVVQWKHCACNICNHTFIAT